MSWLTLAAVNHSERYTFNLYHQKE